MNINESKQKAQKEFKEFCESREPKNFDNIVHIIHLDGSIFIHAFGTPRNSTMLACH